MRGVEAGKWVGVRKRSREWRKERWTVVVCVWMCLGGQLALEGSMGL